MNITGIVEAISQKEEKYGIKVKAKDMPEGIWLNGFGAIPEGIEEGVIVTAKYEDKQGRSGVFHNIKEIALKSDTEATQEQLDTEQPASGKKTAGTKKTAEKTLPDDIQHAILNVMKIKMDCAAIMASAMQGNIDSPQKSDIYFRNVGRLFKWITGSDEIP
ncbi:MAG: hypothetical protein DRN17_00110 [Thermoplasmata archaeon]|nr:MAG: hypothetical protein DRN17_00110 [Thermoplasmata archaeon]